MFILGKTFLWKFWDARKFIYLFFLFIFLFKKSENSNSNFANTSDVPQMCVAAHRVICLERAVGKCFKNMAAHKQQWSGPGWAGNLCCCLPFALADLAFFPLRFRILPTKPQLKLFSRTTPLFYKQNIMRGFSLDEILGFRFRNKIKFNTLGSYVATSYRKVKRKNPQKRKNTLFRQIRFYKDNTSKTKICLQNFYWIMQRRWAILIPEHV